VELAPPWGNHRAPPEGSATRYPSSFTEPKKGHLQEADSLRRGAALVGGILMGRHQQGRLSHGNAFDRDAARCPDEAAVALVRSSALPSQKITIDEMPARDAGCATAKRRQPRSTIAACVGGAGRCARRPPGVMNATPAPARAAASCQGGWSGEIGDMAVAGGEGRKRGTPRSTTTFPLDFPPGAKGPISVQGHPGRSRALKIGYPAVF